MTRLMLLEPRWLRNLRLLRASEVSALQCEDSGTLFLLKAAPTRTNSFAFDTTASPLRGPAIREVRHQRRDALAHPGSGL